MLLLLLLLLLMLLLLLLLLLLLMLLLLLLGDVVCLVRCHKLVVAWRQDKLNLLLLLLVLIELLLLLLQKRVVDDEFIVRGNGRGHVRYFRRLVRRHRVKLRHKQLVILHLKMRLLLAVPDDVNVRV